MLPQTCHELLQFKYQQKEVLKNFVRVHEEPDRDGVYIDRPTEYAAILAQLECLGGDLAAMKRMEQQKVNIHTLEYATISGAGKSRFVLRQLGQPLFRNIPMNLVALNFNGGTGAGSDTPSVLSSTAEKAMSRLLLSRGLFSTDPDMLFVNKTKLPDESLPQVNTVIDALFEDRFTSGEGLLVVHLDELWQLKKMKNDLASCSSSTKPEDRDESFRLAKYGVDSWIKAFIGCLLEYSFKHSLIGRYILPVVTHTCPDNDLLQNPELDNTNFSPTGLQILPFSLEQSVKLLTLKRKEGCGEHIDDIVWDSWRNAIALAGGHPGLLLQCFTVLVDGTNALEHNPTTEGAICTGLLSTNRMKRYVASIDVMTPADIVSFVTDCLLLRDVGIDRHHRCLRVGVGWFQPNLEGRQGRVSSPFPILVSLMQHCADDKYSVIGTALNPRAGGFSPTKAMEYVSALAVLLHRTRSIELWRDCSSTDAFALVEKATEEFFTVWKLKNQAVLDFGGLLSGWKILGQTKMQEAGTNTVQALTEVLDAAWKIGNRVSKKKLTGKLHAYWVSSREAQQVKVLKRLVHSFRVAMMGTISKDEVQQIVITEKRQRGSEDPKVTVYDLMNVLTETAVRDDYMFTYVGRISGDKNHDSLAKHAKTSDDNFSILQLGDLLPKGVFAGWG